METITKAVELPKEITEIAAGSANIVVASYKALQDGFQAGADIPAVLTSAVANLPTMVTGMDQLDDEWDQARSKFLLAWAIEGERAFDEISKLREAAKAAEAAKPTE